jgi:DtxR family Mn-dependent transcriptional regulator
MSETLSLSASLEDYLETIYDLVERHRVARVRDISARMSVNMSSVTGALRQLSSYNLVHYEPYEVITLTEAGRAHARELVRRHNVLKNFLLNVLSLDRAVAEDTAHRMEHAVDAETLERLVRFAEFVERCPRGGREWIESFQTFCVKGAPNEQCERCLESCLRAFRERRQKKAQDEGKSSGSVPLTALVPGEKGRVVKVGGRGAIRKKIVEMGIVPGTTIELERLAPLGDPMELKVKGYHLSLRKEEAVGILVEQVETRTDKGESRK